MEREDKIREKVYEILSDLEATPQEIIDALPAAWEAACEDRKSMGQHQISKARKK